MPTYAKRTDVTPERSRAEIEATLKRYGAGSFGFFADSSTGMHTIMFEAEGRRVRFDVHVDGNDEYVRIHPGTGYGRSNAEKEKAYDRLLRQRWRALALVVKAKLEAVDAGIVTFEEEFLAHIMLPDGTTVGGWMGPQLQAVYDSGDMPPILPPAQKLLERSDA